MSFCRHIPDAARIDGSSGASCFQISDIGAMTVAHRPSTRVICYLAFYGQDGNSMPHSPTQRKRFLGNFGKLKLKLYYST